MFACSIVNGTMDQGSGFSHSCCNLSRDNLSGYNLSGDILSNLILTLERPGGGGIRPPWQKILFFNMKTGFKDPETPWLPQFYTNESNGTKFSACFYIGMGLRDFFARNSLGENGYFIGFWDFRPHFKLILHTSKWILCPQKVWKLFIYVLGSIQHWEPLNWKSMGGGAESPPPPPGFCKYSQTPGFLGLRAENIRENCQNGQTVPVMPWMIHLE